MNAGTPIQRHDERTHKDILNASATWDPGNLVAGGGTFTTISVPGAENGDFALASLDSLSLGANLYTMLYAFVDGADVVRVYLWNHDGSAHDFGSGTLRVRVMKHSP